MDNRDQDKNRYNNKNTQRDEQRDRSDTSGSAKKERINEGYSELGRKGGEARKEQISEQGVSKNKRP